MPKAKTTKKQKVENYVLKHPEAGPSEIAKKMDCDVSYAGALRRELAKTHNLPPLKRGRKAKVTTPKPHVPPKTNMQRAAWEEFEAEMLVKEATDGTTPNLFRRMLTALGMQ